MTTQGAIFNYEEVIDLHTEVGRVSVIGIHTPTGDTPRTLCPGFFQQFKRYKYLGCSISVVPVATLPADPLAVSYEAGEERLMDPRDLANPMMFHGCHGNDLGNILNRLYSAGLVDGDDLTQILRSDSVDLMNMFNGEDDGEPVLQLLENLYYRALTDNTWKKAHIQRGFRKAGLRPRIYSLATNMQIQNATALGGFNAPGPFQGDLELDPLDPSSSGFADLTDPTVNPVRYFTPRTVPLGWLDTRQVVPYVPEGNAGDVSFANLDDTIAGLVRGKTVWNELPKIFMGVILMPPAYRIEQYFRVIINHAFAFKEFRGISMSNDMLELPPNYENWNEMLSAGESGGDVQTVSLTVSIKNNASASRTASVAYVVETNPDPFTVQKSIGAGATSVFDAYTVPVGDSVRITNVSSTASVDVEIDGTHGAEATLYVTLNSNGTVSTSWTA